MDLRILRKAVRSFVRRSLVRLDLYNSSSPVQLWRVRKLCVLSPFLLLYKGNDIYSENWFGNGF